LVLPFHQAIAGKKMTKPSFTGILANQKHETNRFDRSRADGKPVTRGKHDNGEQRQSHFVGLILLLIAISPGSSFAQSPSSSADSLKEQPNQPADLSSVPPDLTPPSMTIGQPERNKRVKHQLDRYRDTDVYHSLFLPKNWEADKKFPVIVEYAGNGPYQNKLGDRCSGLVEDCNMGFGISGGSDFIWICLPYVDPTHQHNQRQWWGDLDETVQYCKEATQMMIDHFGGDENNFFLCGFSRGSIACHYIGLHDDEIAKRWAGFICHSHYDGVRTWNYANSDRASAVKRLNRLNGRPEFITQENSVESIRLYLEENLPNANVQLHRIPFRNHSDQWLLRDVPLRASLRDWLSRQVESKETSRTTEN
jgi:hypothetical protein